MVPSFLRREQSLLCFSFFMQHLELIMPLSVALVSIRKGSTIVSVMRPGRDFD